MVATKPLLSSVASFYLLGCGPQIFDPPQSSATDASPITTGENPNAEDGAADDTGPVLGTGGENVLIDGCLIDDEVFFGYVHQCEGTAIVNAFEDGFLPAGPQWGGDFGPDVSGDSYENPKVMACCDVYQEPPPAQAHFYGCARDNLDQFCQNASAHVLHFWGDTEDPEEAADAMALAAWVSTLDGMTDCQTALHTAAGMSWNQLDPMSLDSVGWPIGVWVEAPDEQWPSISSPAFSVGAIIEAVHIPEQAEDYIECVGISGNNSQTIMEMEASPEFELILVDGGGVVSGPTYDFSPMVGNLEFASNDNSCSAPLCSHIHFSENTSDWTLHSLSFYSSASTMISDETTYMTVDWFHIELAGPVQAIERGVDSFQVPSGQATFLLGGEMEGEPHRLIVTNASSILVEKVGDDWEMAPFVLQYFDSREDSWLLLIAGAEWTSPI